MTATPCCPRCGQPPIILLGGGRQAFCGTDDCDVFTWDTAVDAATFEANARPIEIVEGGK